MIFSTPDNPTPARIRAKSLASTSHLPLPDYPPWPTFTKAGELVGTIPHLTILMGRGEGGVGLEKREVKLLGSMLAKVGMDPASCCWVHDWDEVRAGGIGYVVSVGEQGLKAWHHWGLVKVNMHGCVFEHRDDQGGEFAVMPLQHPGSCFQQTAWGYEVKEQMIEDLKLMATVVSGARQPWDGLANIWCAKCSAARVKKGVEPPRRKAEWWVGELDGVGLCEDHYRKRASIKRTDAGKRPKVKPEIEGQMGLLEEAGVNP